MERKEQNTMHAVRKFNVTFNEPKFNAVYEFERCKSGAFAYGNGSAVVVERNGKEHAFLDTRYNSAVMGDFTAWCKEWLIDNLNPDYEPVITEI